MNDSPVQHIAPSADSIPTLFEQFDCSDIFRCDECGGTWAVGSDPYHTHDCPQGAAQIVLDQPYDDVSLTAFAQFLAREMRFNIPLARSRSVGWYREQIGEELCSFERGVLLREFTLRACHASMVGLHDSAQRANPDRIDMGIVPYPPRLRPLTIWIPLAFVLFVVGLFRILGGQ